RLLQPPTQSNPEDHRETKALITRVCYSVPTVEVPPLQPPSSGPSEPEQGRAGGERDRATASPSAPPGSFSSCFYFSKTASPSTHSHLDLCGSPESAARRGRNWIKAPSDNPPPPHLHARSFVSPWQETTFLPGPRNRHAAEEAAGAPARRRYALLLFRMFYNYYFPSTPSSGLHLFW
ncbi:hypothetical protein GOODEAATRI_010408, partial [Goodea atripinnis]